MTGCAGVWVARQPSVHLRRKSNQEDQPIQSQGPQASVTSLRKTVVARAEGEREAGEESLGGLLGLLRGHGSYLEYGKPV